jgi:hypothetical protein
MDIGEQQESYDAYMSDKSRAIAVDVMKAASGSLVNWFERLNSNEDTRIKGMRNRKEMLVIANAVDRLVSEGVLLSSAGLETLIRRFVGIHNADVSNDWSIASALDYDSRQSTLLPPSVASWAIKSAKLHKAVSGENKDSKSKSATNTGPTKQQKGITSTSKSTGASTGGSTSDVRSSSSTQ